MGSRDVPYEDDARCDVCGHLGAFDFMGDYLCFRCSLGDLEVDDLSKERKEVRTYPYVPDNGTGCVFGRVLSARMAEWEEKVDREIGEVKRKVDRMTWALASAALALVGAAVGLFLNLL